MEESMKGQRTKIEMNIHLSFEDLKEVLIHHYQEKGISVDTIIDVTIQGGGHPPFSDGLLVEAEAYPE
jgi:hypothetical protein